MNDVDFPVARVLDGIDAAAAAPACPVKVNVVVKRGVNEALGHRHGRRFRGTGHTRPLHRVHGRRRDERLAARRRRPRRGDRRAIDAEFPLEPVEAAYRGEVASASATSTAPARSASSRRSPSRSAATAPGRASPPTASSTPACSPSAATTCARSSAAARPTTSSRSRSRRLAASRRPLLGDPHRGDRERCRKVEMSYIGG